MNNYNNNLYNNNRHQNRNSCNCDNKQKDSNIIQSYTKGNDSKPIPLEVAKLVTKNLAYGDPYNPYSYFITLNNRK